MNLLFFLIPIKFSHHNKGGNMTKEEKEELKQALKKYDLLLKNYGSKYKDQAWQAISSEFPKLTRGMKLGDIGELKFRAELFKAGDTWTEPVTDMKFMWVPAGCYQMGSNSGEDDEKPVHEVCLNGFWMSKFEVTQGHYKKIMGTNPSNFKSGDNYPVEWVSWNDAKNFISRLNEQSGRTFKLPTEAQWEYAARSGGKDQEYAGGNDVSGHGHAEFG